jgi:hypothetical protein
MKALDKEIANRHRHFLFLQRHYRSGRTHCRRRMFPWPISTGLIQAREKGAESQVWVAFPDRA